MSDKDPLKMTEVELREHALAGGDLSAIFAERGVRGKPYTKPIPDALDLPMHVKSLRLPLRLVEATEAVDYPSGFSGLVRVALEEWLERHTGAEAELHDARRALDTLTRIVQRLDKAA